MNLLHVINDPPGTTLNNVVLGPLWVDAAWDIKTTSQDKPFRNCRLKDETGEFNFTFWGEFCRDLPTKGNFFLNTGQGEIRDYKGKISISCEDGEFRMAEAPAQASPPQGGGQQSIAPPEQWQGQTVGMALKEACEFSRSKGLDPSSEEGRGYIQRATVFLCKLADHLTK